MEIYLMHIDLLYDEKQILESSEWFTYCVEKLYVVGNVLATVHFTALYKKSD